MPSLVDGDIILDDVDQLMSDGMMSGLDSDHMDEFLCTNNMWPFEVSADFSPTFTVSVMPSLAGEYINLDGVNHLLFEDTMAGLDSYDKDVFFCTNNMWPSKVANIASSPLCFLASLSTFTSDTTTNSGVPTGTNASLMQSRDFPSTFTTSVLSSQVGGDINLDGVDLLLSEDAAINSELPAGTNASLMQSGDFPPTFTASIMPSLASGDINLDGVYHLLFEDAGINSGVPRGTNASLMQSGDFQPTFTASVMSSMVGRDINLDSVDHLLFEGTNASLMQSGDFPPTCTASVMSSMAGGDINLDGMDHLLFEGTNASLMQSGDFQPTFTRSVMSSLAGEDINLDSVVHLLFEDAAINSELPTGTSASLMQSGDFTSTFTASVMPSLAGEDINLDSVDHLLFEGTMVGLDSYDKDVFFCTNNTWPSEVTNIASSLLSFLASPSTFPSNVATYSELPMGTNVSSIQSSIPATPSHILLSGRNSWPPEVTTVASSPFGFFASLSTLPSDVAINLEIPADTNASLMQHYISTMSSQDVSVDRDGLNPILLSGDNVLVASSSPSSAASPLISSSVAKAIPVSAMPTSANTCGTHTSRTSSSTLEWVPQAIIYIRETRREKTMITLEQVRWCDDGQFRVMITGQPFTLDRGTGRPRIGDANYRGVRNSVLLPVFQTGNYSCLGIIEFITIQKHSFIPDINAICSALQAVNLTTTHASSSPTRKFNTASHEEAISEIFQVLRAACTIHKLPLAQTWATCAQQGKQCKRHADKNCLYCISTVDVACYVNDPRMQFFHEACTKHHLQPGQGVVGEAFTTNQPCFLPDIGSSSEQEYPLSDKANTFTLKGAMAIRVRCTRTGTTDFVLEFFLPTDCEGENEQRTVLDSLGDTMERLSQTLRLVRDKEMEDDLVWEMNELNSFGFQNNKKAKRRKPMEQRSSVWKSFTKVMVGGTVKVKCKYCGKNYCYASKHGTSALRSHLGRCKRNPDNRITGPL